MDGVRHILFAAAAEAFIDEGTSWMFDEPGHYQYIDEAAESLKLIDPRFESSENLSEVQSIVMQCVGKCLAYADLGFMLDYNYQRILDKYCPYLDLKLIED